MILPSTNSNDSTNNDGCSHVVITFNHLRVRGGAEAAEEVRRIEGPHTILTVVLQQQQQQQLLLLLLLLLILLIMIILILMMIIT